MLPLGGDATALLINITPPQFQSYFAAKHFGFAACGENPANVSQFVARMRHGDSRVIV
jgi:hypothetical protein